jgi:hypothetical protein
MSFSLVVNGWSLEIKPLAWNCLSEHARDWKSLFRADGGTVNRGTMA